jgi:hypothetical protein
VLLHTFGATVVSLDVYMLIVQCTNLVNRIIALRAAQPSFDNIFIILALEEITFVATRVVVVAVTGKCRWQGDDASLAVLLASVWGNEIWCKFSNPRSAALKPITNEKSRFEAKAALVANGASPTLAPLAVVVGVLLGSTLLSFACDRHRRW